MTDDMSHSPDDVPDEIKRLQELLGPDVQFIAMDPGLMISYAISKNLSSCIHYMIDSAEAGIASVMSIVRASASDDLKTAIDRHLGIDTADLRDQVLAIMVTVEHTVDILHKALTDDDDSEWQDIHTEMIEGLRAKRLKFIADTESLIS